MRNSATAFISYPVNRKSMIDLFVGRAFRYIYCTQWHVRGHNECDPDAAAGQAARQIPLAGVSTVLRKISLIIFGQVSMQRILNLSATQTS